MEDGRILDTALSASESFGSFNPEYGRLNDGRGWYTGAKTTSQDWLEINLNTSHIVTAVATQVKTIIFIRFQNDINVDII